MRVRQGANCGLQWPHSPVQHVFVCIALILFVRPVLTIPWNGSEDLKLIIVAASRRRSCCLPRRRRRWTRLCGRSSQRHPTPPTPFPPTPPSHLPPLLFSPSLLPPTPFAAAAGAAAASQWSSRAGLGRAGPDVVRPGRAGPDSVRNVAAAASPRQPAAPPTAFGCGRGGAKPARGRRSVKQNKVCAWFDDCVQ